MELDESSGSIVEANDEGTDTLFQYLKETTQDQGQQFVEEVSQNEFNHSILSASLETHEPAANPESGSLVQQTESMNLDPKESEMHDDDYDPFSHKIQLSYSPVKLSSNPIVNEAVISPFEKSNTFSSSSMDEFPKDFDFASDEVAIPGEDEVLKNIDNPSNFSMTVEDNRLASPEIVEKAEEESAEEPVLEEKTQEINAAQSIPMMDSTPQREKPEISQSILSSLSKLRVYQKRMSDRFSLRPNPFPAIATISTVPMPVESISIHDFLASADIQFGPSPVTNTLSLSRTPQRNRTPTARRSMGSCKRVKNTPRLTPSAISRLTSRKAENWISRMLEDESQREVPYRYYFRNLFIVNFNLHGVNRLVAAYAEGPLLQTLEKQSNYFKKVVDDLAFEVDRLEKELSYKNPEVFSIMSGSPNVKRAILTDNMRRIQQRCMASAKASWAEKSASFRVQLQEVWRFFCFFIYLA
jgi:hypothetical protein